MTGGICVVCQESIDETGSHTLSCNHSFHAGCIVCWFRRGESSCPVCRDTGGSDGSASNDETASLVSGTSAATELQNFRIFSTRGQVSQLVRDALAAVRCAGSVRSRAMQRLRVRANRFTKATEEANNARQSANLFLRTHSGPLLQGTKRYNALVRMWETRERRLRDAALDLCIEHT
jgi:hypothetical protein